MRLQTDGFVPLGELPNDERFHCLICRDVPERIWANLHPLERKDLPKPVAAQAPNDLAVTYRLCPRCQASEPDAWKIRLLILERMTAGQ